MLLKVSLEQKPELEKLLPQHSKDCPDLRVVLTMDKFFAVCPHEPPRVYDPDAKSWDVLEWVAEHD